MLKKGSMRAILKHLVILMRYSLRRATIKDLVILVTTNQIVPKKKRNLVNLHKILSLKFKKKKKVLIFQILIPQMPQIIN